MSDGIIRRRDRRRKDRLTRLQQREDFRHTSMSTFIMVVEDKIVPHTPNYRNNHEENCAMFHTKIFVPSETIRTLKRHVSTIKTARTPDAN
jgi:hypothetical protein